MSWVAGSTGGESSTCTPCPTTTVEALYGFEGSEHAFRALVHVEQTGLEAVITGVVIDGWGKGQPVSGSYSEISCAHDGMTTDCWQGRLEVADAG